MKYFSTELPGKNAINSPYFSKTNASTRPEHPVKYSELRIHSTALWKTERKFAIDPVLFLPET